MKLVTILVTRSKSCSVKTLHTMLRLNLMCMKTNTQHEIVYVNDDAHEKQQMIINKLKAGDRLLFIEFGVHIDDVSLERALDPKYDCIVYPGARAGVNWELFKKKSIENVDEPSSQIGLEFDTDIGIKVAESIYKVKSTDPKAWVVDTKTCHRTIKNKKTQMVNLPTARKDMFDKLIAGGMKIYAYTGAKLTITYPHECISNILESAGVSLNP